MTYPEEMSDLCKDFIKSILQINPLKRPSAKELLKSEFLIYAEEYMDDIDEDNSKTLVKKSSVNQKKIDELTL